ncbi:MAG: phosphatase PAP2 family protein [Oscillospiraceae bacterium]
MMTAIFKMLQPLDLAILNFIYNTFSCAFMDKFMVLVNYLAYQGIIWIILGVTLLFFKRTRVIGFAFLIALTLSFLIGDVGLKHFIMRSRPFVDNPDFVLKVSVPSGSSFPSTHSAFAAAIATVAIAKLNKLGRIPLVCVAITIIFSRLYNYLHYPSDVVAGILLGIVCGLAALLIVKKFEEKKREIQ